jgi:hypothetical protein
MTLVVPDAEREESGPEAVESLHEATLPAKAMSRWRCEHSLPQECSDWLPGAVCHWSGLADDLPNQLDQSVSAGTAEVSSFR